MASEYGLKRHFNGDAARLIGGRIRAVHPEFDIEGYASDVERRIPGKELKDRVLVLAEGLRTRLPQDYPEAVALLLPILGDELAEGEGMFNASWFLMPVARFVEEYGLEHPEVSLDAIEEITKRHTGEYAIRPYIENHYEPTMRRVARWALSPSHNVRRLATEGIRSRLPWARTLTVFVKDPQPVLEILEPLRSDPSEYVRKSVANNLNDISKDAPEVALATALRWMRESPTPETTWIVKHALRTLVKKGDQQALAILGATGGEHLRVPRLEITPGSVTVGDTLVLSFDIENTDDRSHSVTVDYVVHHVRKNGRSIPKVFKLATLDLAAGERRTLHKTHMIKEVQTRRYYAGEHLVDIQANGLVKATERFGLRT
ncbi:DNA alkylation repair protein [Streptomyces sp. NBC_00237]|uniref:DNA alkylation repair protein n=1 Tax=Streptomyces sp. NBC_00237 TaxID=2975687 RepID=UPI0022572F5B|nr:DNA alkylation repair protein [Streptomyces sp. NBC_00237]MCX5205627.1 DNA alkylation repair protein [Streptomyces sp. NBC_00237]